MGRWHLRIVRAMFLLAGTLSGLLGALIAASPVLARDPTSDRFVAVGVIVGAVFVFLGVLILAIGRQLADLARTSGETGSGSRLDLTRSLSRLATLLLIAIGAVALVLAAITIGVIGRIGDGAAVFG